MQPEKQVIKDNTMFSSQISSNCKMTYKLHSKNECDFLSHIVHVIKTKIKDKDIDTDESEDISESDLDSDIDRSEDEDNLWALDISTDTISEMNTDIEENENKRKNNYKNTGKNVNKIRKMYELLHQIEKFFINLEIEVCYSEEWPQNRLKTMLNVLKGRSEVETNVYFLLNTITSMCQKNEKYIIVIGNDTNFVESILHYFDSNDGVILLNLLKLLIIAARNIAKYECNSVWNKCFINHRYFSSEIANIFKSQSDDKVLNMAMNFIKESVKIYPTRTNYSEKYLYTHNMIHALSKHYLQDKIQRNMQYHLEFVDNTLSLLLTIKEELILPFMYNQEKKNLFNRISFIILKHFLMLTKLSSHRLIKTLTSASVLYSKIMLNLSILLNYLRDQFYVSLYIEKIIIEANLNLKEKSKIMIEPTTGKNYEILEPLYAFIRGIRSLWSSIVNHYDCPFIKHFLYCTCNSADQVLYLQNLITDVRLSIYKMQRVNQELSLLGWRE